MSDTDGWVELPERPGYRCKIFKYGNVTVRTFRPILSDSERKRREEGIMSNIARILRKYDDLEDENETDAS